MAQELTHYKGDTFYAEGLYTVNDADSTPVDLNLGGITIESYVRGRNGDKFPLNVDLLPETGKYAISGPSDDWPLGRVVWIVRYTQDDIKRSSEPVVINVEAT